MDNLKHKTGLSLRFLGRTLPLSYSRLMRWRGRVRKGLPLLLLPGPKPLGSFPWARLHEGLRRLQHRAKRTLGTSALYQDVRQGISRRVFQVLVRRQRQRHHARQRQAQERLQWTTPGVVWSLDGAEYLPDSQGRKLLLNPIQDMASRFRLDPWICLHFAATEMAAHLEKLFRQYGAPLFFKRDNGSAFNNRIIDEVFGRFGVLPLNSPPHYAQFNGAMENGIRQIKSDLAEVLPVPVRWELDIHAPLVRQIVRARNYVPRQSLQGLCPVEFWSFGQNRITFTLKKRHQIFGWIMARTLATMQSSQALDQRLIDAAWRKSAVSWLRCHGLVIPCTKPIVLPHFSENWSQN